MPDSAIFPALRCRMGDWIYYVTFMSCKDITQWILPTEEIYKGKYLREYDTDFSGKDEIERRFVKIIDTINKLINDEITDSIYTLEVFFFTLFIYLYDMMYGLGSDLSFKQPNRLPPNLKNNLLKANKKMKDLENIDASGNPEVPLEIIDCYHDTKQVQP